MVHHNHQVSERGSKLFKDTDTKDYLGKNYDKPKNEDTHVKDWTINSIVKSKKPTTNKIWKKNMFAIKVKK